MRGSFGAAFAKLLWPCYYRQYYGDVLMCSHWLHMFVASRTIGDALDVCFLISAIHSKFEYCILCMLVILWAIFVDPRHCRPTMPPCRHAYTIIWPWLYIAIAAAVLNCNFAPKFCLKHNQHTKIK